MGLVARMPLLDPLYLAKRALRSEVALMARAVHGTVLDVGCGAAPYRGLFGHARYIGLEVATASQYGSAKSGADILYDGKRLPLADASVDNLLCSQVLEHVFEPDDFLGELRRVLRPGGRLLLTVPFVWDEHEQPFDYARYSSFGLRHLAAKNGFDVEQQRRTLADASLFAQLWLAYLLKVVRSTQLPRPLATGFLACLSLPANIGGLLLGALLPRNHDLYLDNTMILVRPEEKPEP